MDSLALYAYIGLGRPFPAKFYCLPSIMLVSMSQECPFMHSTIPLLPRPFYHAYQDC